MARQKRWSSAAPGLPRGPTGVVPGSEVPDGVGPRRKRMEDLKVYDDAEVLESYLTEAAWFWFEASTLEKSLEAGLHRAAAVGILQEIRRRGLPEPERELAYGTARRAFPPDDLRRW